jgi:hypothetical protein
MRKAAIEADKAAKASGKSGSKKTGSGSDS